MEALFGKRKPRRIAVSGLVLLLWLPATVISAATLYVSQDSFLPVAPYANWATAANTIQQAIEWASTGDEIIVTNGVYATGGKALYGNLTNRIAVTKALTIRSVNGPAVTIIEGYQVPGTTNGASAVRCAYLMNGALLAGFTLRNGATHTNGTHSSESNGGGAWCESVQAVISNCVLVANACNSSGSGGGAYQGMLQDCIVTGNSAGSGAGIGWGAARNCVISNNNAVIGVGAYASTLNDCLIVSNAIVGNYFYHWGGGGAFCNFTNCTIANNNIGSGAYRSTLDNCVVLGNGWGMEASSATRCTFATNGSVGAMYSSLTNCTLVGNSDAGAEVCTLVNCTSTGNLGAGVTGDRAGSTLYNCFITRNGRGVEANCDLHNCVVANNRGRPGWLCTLNNCTVTGNIGGVDRCEVNNSIVYYNFSPLGGYENYKTNSTFNYSCTTPLPSDGVGNISDEPQLASTSHVMASSPCRGAGSSDYVSGLDIDNEPWLSPPSIGCDEYHGEASSESLTVTVHASFNAVASGFEVQFVAEFNGLVSSSEWNFGDGTVANTGAFAAHRWTSGGDFPVVITGYNSSHPGGVSATTVVHVVASPIHYVSAATANPVAPFTSWETAAATIQDAVDAAYPGGTVLVTNGFYASRGKVVGGPTNRVAVMFELHLRSVNGPQATFIVGEHPDEDEGTTETIRCVYLADRATLSGFTLTDGAADWTADDYDDQQDEKLDSGGGVFCQSLNAVISNCVFTRNYASAYGGGAYLGTLQNCVLRDNSADAGGGAEESILQNCILTGNYGNDGAAANGCELKSCLVYGNWSQWEGVVNSSVLNNCTVSRNHAVAYNPAGVSFSFVTNSIIYENYAGFGQSAVSNVVESTIAYSCTLPLPSDGVGNISSDPRFVNPAAGDFHLRPGSACIDAGLDLTGIVGSDLDGNPRPLDGNRDGSAAFDMGAYEFNGLYFTGVTRVGNTIHLSWFDKPPGTRLQHTTTLTDPNWIDVPTSNSQTSIEFPVDAAAGFFRLTGP